MWRPRRSSRLFLQARLVSSWTLRWKNYRRSGMDRVAVYSAFALQRLCVMSLDNPSIHVLTHLTRQTFLRLRVDSFFQALTCTALGPNRRFSSANELRCEPRDSSMVQWRRFPPYTTSTPTTLQPQSLKPHFEDHVANRSTRLVARSELCT